MRTSLLVGLAAILPVCAAATAGERSGYPGPVLYGHDSYGFAGASVGGDYIGAPFTRFPSPSAIVPPAWGYGTYGIPTMTGIRQAPVGEPRVYVVRGVGPASHRSHRGSDAGAEAPAAAGGARVVSVTVPRR